MSSGFLGGLRNLQLKCRRVPPRSQTLRPRRRASLRKRRRRVTLRRHRRSPHRPRLRERRQRLLQPRLRPQSQKCGEPSLCAQKISQRSEDHTSELQSPSVISYAVFCLKKKKTKNNILSVDSRIKKTKTRNRRILQ